MSQIITEVWTEPQDGRVVNHATMAGLASKDIAARLFPRDLEVMLTMMMMMITMMMITAQVISSLVTFEHLSLMCGNPCVASPPGSSLQTQDQAQPGHDWSHRSVALLSIISIAYY